MLLHSFDNQRLHGQLLSILMTILQPEIRNRCTVKHRKDKAATCCANSLKHDLILYRRAWFPLRAFDLTYRAQFPFALLRICTAEARLIIRNQMVYFCIA